MGIRGLNTCISKSAPHTIVPVRWDNWCYKRLGVDIQCFLYRALANHLCPLEIIAAQIAEFRRLQIEPVYVFDGKPPSEKDSVVSKRKFERAIALKRCEELRESLNRETNSAVRDSILVKIREIESEFPNLTYEIKDEIKQFLYACGVMFVAPTCEADSILAYWCKRGVLDGVVSFDLDFIPRGCNLLVPKHISEAPGASWIQYEPSRIIRGLSLDESRFVDLCVLMGSDYTPTLSIVPWKLALSALQRNESLCDIWARHTFCNWRRADSKDRLENELEMFYKAKIILKGFGDTPESLMESIQWSKWDAGIQEPEMATLDGFKKAHPEWDTQWWNLFLHRV
jgi:flap endonuclease-1